jgi:hypothetical protein
MQEPPRVGTPFRNVPERGALQEGTVRICMGSWELVPRWAAFFAWQRLIDTPKIRRDHKVASASVTSSCNLSLHLHLIAFLHCILSKPIFILHSVPCRHLFSTIPLLTPHARCLPHHCFLAASLLQSGFLSLVKSPPFVGGFY